jgi:hypothetical protein
MAAGWTKATRTYWTDKRQPTRAEGKRAAVDEDRYTNTVEDAAAFERRRAEEAGDYDDDRPTLSELEAEEDGA